MKRILFLEVFRTFLGNYLNGFLGDFLGLLKPEFVDNSVEAKLSTQKHKMAVQRFPPVERIEYSACQW